MAPTAVSKPPPVADKPVATPVAKLAASQAESAPDPIKQCDLSTTCPQCGSQMRPEHAHYRCGTCGYRDSCCF